MPWYAWLVTALVGVSTLVTIGSVGKPRKPTTPGIAVAVVVVNGLFVWGVVALGTRCGA